MKNQNRELPISWRRARLDEIARVVGGSTPDTGNQEYWEGDIVWITPADLGQLHDRWIRTSGRRISREGHENSGIEMLPSGSVVLSSRAPIGYLGIATRPLCTNQGCKSFIPSKGIDSEYLYWRILYSVPELKELGSGATFAEVSKSSLEAFEISFPPISEQKRIAGILNERMAAIDKARTAAEAQLEAAGALLAAYLREVFPEQGRELPPNWHWAKLGEICIGSGQYGLSFKADTDPRGTMILGMNNIKEGRICWERVKYVQLPIELINQYKLMKGDVLFNRTNSAELVGKSAVFNDDKEAVFASYLIRLRTKHEVVLPGFLCFFINSEGRTFIGKNMTRAIGQVNISASTLNHMPVPIPSLAEQSRILLQLNVRLNRFNLLKAELVAQARELNALPQALLRQAFNGEL